MKVLFILVLAFSGLLAGPIPAFAEGADLHPGFSDSDPVRRAASAGEAAQRGDTGAVDGLGQLLGDPVPMVRLAAVDALGRLGRPGLSCLAKSATAMSRVGALGTQGALRELALLEPEADTTDAAFRVLVVQALSVLHSRLVPGRERAWLRDKDPKVRAIAASAVLGWPPDRDLETLLISLLKDPSLVVRTRAAATLGVWGSRDAVPELSRMLRRAPAPLRLKVAQALGNIGDPRAKGALEYACSHSDPLTENAAAQALARIATLPRVPGGTLMPRP